MMREWKHAAVGVVLLVGCYDVFDPLPEVCRIFCATANPVEVIVAETSLGRGIMGVVDGGSPLGVEGEQEAGERKAFLRKIGLKWG